MRITTTQLRKIIREELQILREEKGSASIRNIIAAHDDDPMKEVPPAKLKSADIPVKPGDDYHVVYGRVVAQRNDKDLAYWAAEEDQWEVIDDEERHHPTKIHKPSKD
jgi:hypothetical protein